MKTVKIKEKINEDWPRSVSEELLEAWQTLRRKCDPDTMATELGYSRPVIDRALRWGYVSMPELPDKICVFFQRRLEKEKAQAVELMGLKQEVESITKPHKK